MRDQRVVRAVDVAAVAKEALSITVFVFVMMLIVDFIDAATERRVSYLIRGGRWREYVIASFLGSTPGCLGAFVNVSLYVHGLIGFGAVVAGMIATSGDEAFVMLARFPGTALLLFGTLFGLGIVCGWVSDNVIKAMGFVPCESCPAHVCETCPSGGENAGGDGVVWRIEAVLGNLRTLSFARFLLIAFTGFILMLLLSGRIGPAFWGWKRLALAGLALCALVIILAATEHYLHEHIWEHIIKEHLFRVFLWSFAALLLVHGGLAFLDLEAFIRNHLVWVLVIAALLGVVPESGPHLVFVMLFAEGLVPFSVLFAASFVQDGHGMLPLLSYSIKDSALIKAFNVVFGLIAGGILFILGV